jgi:hypothetical protein
MSRTRQLGCIALLMAAAGWLAGCTPAATYQRMLQSPDSLERAKGCRMAGESGDRSAVPLLVDRLEDRDRAVRMVADIALRQITYKDFGYRESDPKNLRDQAVARWRQYANTAAPRAGQGGGR